MPDVSKLKNKTIKQETWNMNIMAVITEKKNKQKIISWIKNYHLIMGTQILSQVQKLVSK